MNQVIATNPSQLQLAIEMSQEKIDLIRRTICKACNNEEFSIFLHACKRTGLDPLMRQIYAVKYGSQMTIQTGIDGFRLIAERTGCYAPGREPSYAYDANGNLLSATSYIKKMTPDKTWHEVSATAFYQEYCKIERNGEPSKFWKQMPHGQLAKCAEALALRKAFPGDFSSIYAKEEMEQATNAQMIDVTPIEEAPTMTTISDEQVVQLENLISLCSESDRLNVWKHFYEGWKIKQLNQIPSEKFDMIHKRLTILAQKNQSNEDTNAALQND